MKLLIQLTVSDSHDQYYSYRATILITRTETVNLHLIKAQLRFNSRSELLLHAYTHYCCLDLPWVMLLYICTKIFREGSESLPWDIMKSPSSRLRPETERSRILSSQSCTPKAKCDNDWKNRCTRVYGLEWPACSCCTSGLCRTAVVSICFYKPSARRRLTMYIVWEAAYNVRVQTVFKERMAKRWEAQKMLWRWDKLHTKKSQLVQEDMRTQTQYQGQCYVPLSEFHGVGRRLL